jgi:23S rRNA (adenine1618-N6)-methyltransferase
MNPTEKNNLHPRNLHRSRYDFEILMHSNPKLKTFVHKVKDTDHLTIDFDNPKAVKCLNKSLLMTYYNVQNWDIPNGFLCPPIPGRADYIHYIADLIQGNKSEIPRGSFVKGLDIGVGANCIYPLIGASVYDWDFVATDTNLKALKNCSTILQENPALGEKISLQQQLNSRFIFKDIIEPEDKFHFTMCNPPFHASGEEAKKATFRKLNNLDLQKDQTTKTPNFGGISDELWCDGGEVKFITQMIFESAKYQQQVMWFTTLVSKNEHLKSLMKVLKKINPVDIKVIEMKQGQKTSRILAWTFMNESRMNNGRFDAQKASDNVD